MNKIIGWILVVAILIGVVFLALWYHTIPTTSPGSNSSYTNPYSYGPGGTTYTGSPTSSTSPGSNSSYINSYTPGSSGTTNSYTPGSGNTTYTGSPTSSPLQQATPTSLTIATFNGGSVQTRNFLSDGDVAKDPINLGYYYLGGYASNQAYTIEYISQTQYFNISLQEEPIGSNRVAAEKDLLNRLGITPMQMCQLNYTVSVPYSVDPKYASTDLGFSFCPTAVPLSE